MRWSRMITVVDAHAEGEVGRVITGGVVDVPGATMLEKMRHLDDDASLRRLALFEPRGCAQMSANLLLPPTHADADAGFVVMQPDGAHPMSGSNAMCVTTVLLETGMLAMREPETRVVLDTPAGLVTAAATCRDGRCERVALEFVPSFAAHLDHPLEVEGLGRIVVDVGYGGAFYVLVDAAAAGLAITPASARALVEVGDRIRRAAEHAIEVAHPELPALDRLDGVMFCDRDARGIRNATVLYPGRLDRSPCGTGTAARLAVMAARGGIGAGDRVSAYSVIDSRFDAEILRTTRVGDQAAIVPRIAGRAWIYGVGELGVDPGDPYPQGYALSDTWGPGLAGAD